MSYFSIIIPTYNSAATIKECLDSIFSQTFADFEILVMDGLSSDNTLQIVSQYDDKRISICTEKDKGVYDAMNKGIHKSAGEWLLFLGSDDKLYDTNVLANIANFVLNNKCEIVYGNAYFIGRKYFHDGEFDRVKLFNQKNICHQAIFYNKSVFARLGNYNLEFPINADWDFNLRCFSTPTLSIKYYDLPIVYYNDITGLSDSGNADINFHQLSGAKLNRDLADLKSLLNQKEEFIKRLERSKSYKIGNAILYPFKLIRRLFNI